MQTLAGMQGWDGDSMAAGWIKDYRKEIDSPIWLMPPLYHRIWQWLKYAVNHEEADIPMRDGSVFKVLPGQRLTSYRGIAKAVGWYEGRKWKEPNPKTVSVIITWLQRNSMILVNHGKGNGEYTLITLVNWDFYQSENDKGNAKVTVGKQSVDTNKNDKNEKNINTLYPRLKITDEHLLLAAYFQNAIKARKPDYKFTGTIEKWADVIRLMIDTDKRTPDRIKAVIAWSQADTFWQNNVLSPDKLRKQFDRLELQMQKDNPGCIETDKQYDANGICWNSK